MKATNIPENGIKMELFKRIGYALQVIILAISIPLLSYLEVTHREKPQNPSVKTGAVQWVNAPMLTLKSI